VPVALRNLTGPGILQCTFDVALYERRAIAYNNQADVVIEGKTYRVVGLEYRFDEQRRPLFWIEMQEIVFLFSDESKSERRETVGLGE
jgi:hypothetical protein